MRYSFLILFFIFKSGNLSAREDSAMIKQTDALIEKYYGLSYNDPDSAFLILDSAERLARKVGYFEGLSSALRQKGSFYSERSEYVRSMQFLLKALKEDEKLSNQDGIGMDLLFIGLNFFRQGKTTEALFYMDKAKLTYVNIKDEAGEAMVNSNIGMVYRNTNRLEEALTYYFKVRSYYIKVKNERNLSRIENNIGNIYKDLNQYEKALEHFTISRDLKMKLKDIFGLIKTYSNIADVYVATNRSNQAFTFYENALKLAKKQKAVGLQKDIYLDLSNAYENQGNLQKSLENYKKYSSLKDSIISEKYNKDLADMKIKYDSDKKESENTVLKKDIELQLTKVQKERVLKILFAALSVIVFCAALIVYVQFRNKQKLNKELKNINQKVSNQNNTLRQLNLELIKSEEDLTKANGTKDELIGMISHDLYNPVTSVIRYTSGIIEKSNELSRAELLHSLEMTGNAVIPLQDLLDNILQWARVQKSSIQPNFKPADVKLIIDEIITLYKPSASFKNTKIVLTHDKDHMVCTDNLMVSFILRNLINNAVKFTSPGKIIHIEIKNSDKDLIINIADKGKGFSAEMLKQLNSRDDFTIVIAEGSGIGLAVSRRFVKLLNAELKFDNSAGGGAQVMLRLNRV